MITYYCLNLWAVALKKTKKLKTNREINFSTILNSNMWFKSLTQREKRQRYLAVFHLLKNTFCRTRGTEHHSCSVFVPGPNTLFGRVLSQLAGCKQTIHRTCFALFPSYSGSQKSVRLTDRDLARSPPTNLALADHWSRALPRCPAQHNRPDAGTLLPEPSCLLFPIRVSRAQWDPWMSSSAGHVCEF